MFDLGEGELRPGNSFLGPMGYGRVHVLEQMYSTLILSKAARLLPSGRPRLIEVAAGEDELMQLESLLAIVTTGCSLHSAGRLGRAESNFISVISVICWETSE